ncbi:serine hydrolase domain-containing protein [Isoptericola jiangsuensis]|uniref:serine hydrolase domain-containing protein n=1 Tax=Isoptericola jiangsuensis TaxID=548579 RepID=UPI003AAB59DD
MRPLSMLRRFVLNPVLAVGDGRPGAPWPVPDDGPDPALGAAVARFAAGTPGLHGVVAVHRGELVAEWYGRGRDHRMGRPLGTVDFGPHTLHDVRSVSKSVVALLYGIALADGEVPEVSAPLMAQFPEYPDLVADPRRTGITIEHALTMTTGLQWWERPPYRDPRNGEIAMRLAPDPYRYALERPVEGPPGEAWNYCGGTTEVIGHLIARGTGVPLHEYAWTRLLAPLGIGGAEWIATPERVPVACSGLRLAPRDLARIGRLVQDGGARDGVQVVPSAWVDRMLTGRTATTWGSGYGYQWYLGGTGPDRWVGGIGNGDQRLHVLPGHDLVVVQTTGNYDRAPEQSSLPGLVELVLAHVRD